DDDADDPGARGRRKPRRQTIERAEDSADQQSENRLVHSHSLRAHPAHTCLLRAGPRHLFSVTIRLVSADSQTPFHNAIGALSQLRGTLPPDPPAPKPAAPAAPSPEARKIPKAVIRLERSGRGGKEVTVIEQLALSEAERERW